MVLTYLGIICLRTRITMGTQSNVHLITWERGAKLDLLNNIFNLKVEQY